MPVDLPAAITTYIAAENQGDPPGVARCFTDDAVVKDEGRTMKGTAAIRRWKEETTKKYRHTMEPLAVARQHDAVIVTSRLTGDFPGSPIEVRFFFVLDGEKIASLEIRS